MTEALDDVAPRLPRRSRYGMVARREHETSRAGYFGAARAASTAWRAPRSWGVRGQGIVVDIDGQGQRLDFSRDQPCRLTLPPPLGVPRNDVPSPCPERRQHRIPCRPDHQLTAALIISCLHSRGPGSSSRKTLGRLR